jgi:signal transduction histidine kinase
MPVEVLLSAGRVFPDRYILTIIDITDMKLAKEALDNTNRELHLLSSVTSDDIMGRIKELDGILNDARKSGPGSETRSIIGRIEPVVLAIRRRLELTAIFHKLGAEPPKWQNVQDIIAGRATQPELRKIELRSWVGRLEIYADSLLLNVFHDLIDNALRHGGHASEIVITYHLVSDGLDIIVEDNGKGIPAADKETIFAHGTGTHKGLGLFIDRQILGVTGITIRETGAYGKGARFEIHVPQEKYRII